MESSGCAHGHVVAMLVNELDTRLTSNAGCNHNARPYGMTPAFSLALHSTSNRVGIQRATSWCPGRCARSWRDDVLLFVLMVMVVVVQ